MVTVRPLDPRGLVLHFEEVEAELLLSLTRQLIDLVGSPGERPEDPLAAMVGIDPHARPSDDPALLRLLPDAFRDDDDAALEFRRFTERDLRDAKVRHAFVVQASLGDGGHQVLLQDDVLTAWLGFLNDARLVIGARLEIREDDHEDLDDLPDDDPRAPLYGVYGWLTYLQESVVQVLLA